MNLFLTQIALGVAAEKLSSVSYYFEALCYLRPAQLNHNGKAREG
jgi:hypothetical protein